MLLPDKDVYVGNSENVLNPKTCTVSCLSFFIRPIFIRDLNQGNFKPKNTMIFMEMKSPNPKCHPVTNHFNNIIKYISIT